jgi:hypothetical protein
MITLDKTKAYKVTGHGGVAWVVLGHDSEWEEESWTLCCCESPDSAYFDGDESEYDENNNDCDHNSDMCWVYGESYLVEIPNRVVCVMVGDDRKYVFDMDDLTPIESDDFCPDCGSTDCGWR